MAVDVIPVRSCLFLFGLADLAGAVEMTLFGLLDLLVSRFFNSFSALYLSSSISGAMGREAMLMWVFAIKAVLSVCPYSPY